MRKDAVSKFRLRLHVNRVRETGIQQINQCATVAFRNIDFALE